MNSVDQDDLNAWLRMWADGIVHREDIALFIEELIVKTGDASILNHAPPEIRNAIDQDIRDALEGRRRELFVKDTNHSFDVTESMQSLVTIVRNAGLLGSLGQGLGGADGDGS